MVRVPGESAPIGELGSVLLNGEKLKKYKENQKGRGFTRGSSEPFVILYMHMEILLLLGTGHQQFSHHFCKLGLDQNKGFVVR
jgi:hypothetical protein